jgi:hypothetical protein
MKYLGILFIVIFISCDSVNKNNFKSFINVSFYKGSVDTSIPINCQKISTGKIGIIKDTVINDERIVMQILKQVNILKINKPIEDEICDIRIKCIIHFQESDSIKVCLGESNCLMINETQYRVNNLLSYTIKSNIGYYNYFSVDELKYFSELKGKDIHKNYIDLRKKKTLNGVPIPPNKL